MLFPSGTTRDALYFFGGEINHFKQICEKNENKKEASSRQMRHAGIYHLKVLKTSGGALGTNLSSRFLEEFCYGSAASPAECISGSLINLVVKM